MVTGLQQSSAFGLACIPWDRSRSNASRKLLSVSQGISCTGTCIICMVDLGKSSQQGHIMPECFFYKTGKCLWMCLVCKGNNNMTFHCLLYIIYVGRLWSSLPVLLSGYTVCCARICTSSLWTGTNVHCKKVSNNLAPMERRAFIIPGLVYRSPVLDTTISTSCIT